MPAPDGVDRFILELVALWFQHVMLLQPCHVYLRTLRCSASWAWTGGRYRSQNAAALCRHGNLVVQRDTRTTAGEHTMIQLHPSPFQTCDFAARFPTRCRWINGCRRFSLRPRLLSTSVAVPVAGDAAMAGGDFRRLSAGRYSGDRCSAFQSEKRDLFGRCRGEYSPRNDLAFFYGSCASLNRFMSMVDHSHQKAHIKYIF